MKFGGNTFKLSKPINIIDPAYKTYMKHVIIIQISRY